MKKYIYIVLMTVVLIWTGCKEVENEPTMEVSFPLSIYLPADETNVFNFEGGPRKVMGDPGTTEQFALPNYIYIIIMKKTSDAPETWELWRVITKSGVADEGKWKKLHYSGPLQTTGDSIYQYKENFNELLSPGESFNGRVYAVASAEELTFNMNPLTTIDDLSDVENLTFNSGEVQSSLQHIYSTPYNYIVDGKYYGSISSEYEKVPHLNLMLYHVAAKVDITWSVADSARVKAEGVNPIRLTHMDACNLFKDMAYCFKPMENSSGASPLDPSAGKGDTINLVSASDEGLWWEGRSYFYTIPYTTTGKAGYFPLQMRMETNESAAYYRPTIYLQVNTTSPFVPWLRATFNLKKELTAGTDTKTVNLPTP